MQYVKLTILEALSKTEQGFTVHELLSLIGEVIPYATLEQRLRRYKRLYLLKRGKEKEGKRIRYFITKRGTERLEYLKKTNA